MDPRWKGPVARRRLRSRDARGHLRPVCRRWCPRRTGVVDDANRCPAERSRRLADCPTSRPEAVPRADAEELRRRSPSGGRASPTTPSCPLAPRKSPGVQPPRNPRAVFPAPTRRAKSGQAVVLPRRGRLPDGVRAFLATPITRISDGGPDRAITALAGTFLAMVALGAGCLTVAVSGVAREREVRAFVVTVASAVIVLAWPASAMALDGRRRPATGLLRRLVQRRGRPRRRLLVGPRRSLAHGCHFETITADTSGTKVSCGAYYAAQQQTVTVTVTVRRDTTPPQVTSVSPGRAPDSNGWYNHAVALTFAGSDATSGIASCDAPTYSAPDSGSAAVAGVCRDAAGNTSAPVAFALKYDGTAPQAGASLARGPDANGWYSKPITVSFAGSDATSGIASCTAPGTYTGPDAAAASVARQLHGRCRQSHLCGGIDSLRLDGAERRSPCRTGRPTRTAGIPSRSRSASRAPTRARASRRARPRSATQNPTAPTPRPPVRVVTRPAT